MSSGIASGQSSSVIGEIDKVTNNQSDLLNQIQSDEFDQRITEFLEGGLASDRAVSNSHFDTNSSIDVEGLTTQHALNRHQYNIDNTAEVDRSKEFQRRIAWDRRSAPLVEPTSTILFSAQNDAHSLAKLLGAILLMNSKNHTTSKHKHMRVSTQNTSQVKACERALLGLSQIFPRR